MAGSIGDAGNSAKVNTAQVKGSSLSTEQPVCQVLSMVWPQETNSLDNSGRKPPLARSLAANCPGVCPASMGGPVYGVCVLHCGGGTPTLCSSPPFLDTRPSRHSVDISHLTLTLRQVFPSQVTHLSGQ